MVEIVDEKHLHEYRGGDQERFPSEELSNIKSAIETVDDSIFLETESGQEIPFDDEVATHLDLYSSGGTTEHRLWRNSNHSVDLYNPDRKIAVEIEKTEKKNIWKNLIKFSRGSVGEYERQIEYGCVVVPVNYSTTRKDYNIFRHAQRALKFTSPIMHVEDVVVIGYRDPRPNATDS